MNARQNSEPFLPRIRANHGIGVPGPERVMHLHLQQQKLEEINLNLRGHVRQVNRVNLVENVLPEFAAELVAVVHVLKEFLVGTNRKIRGKTTRVHYNLTKLREQLQNQLVLGPRS